MKRTGAKKILTFVLLCAMLASFMSFGVYADSAFAGSGTADDPYQIKTAADLVKLSENVNKTAKYSEKKYFKLMNDIDLNNTPWTPIGFDDDDNYAFMGVFMGNGKTISKVNVDIKSGSKPLGLFGYVTGEVCDLYVDNSYVHGVDYATNAGGVIGRIGGGALICNVHVTNTEVKTEGCAGGVVGLSLLRKDADTAVINSCSFDSGTVTGAAGGNNYKAAGGILGAMQTTGTLTVSGCWCTDSTIKVGYGHAGGIVGSQYYSSSTQLLKLSNCFNTSDVCTDKAPSSGSGAGGIVGYNRNSNTKIEKCYNTGSITATHSTKIADYASGILGFGNGNSGDGYIEKCFNAGALNSVNTAATSAGYNIRSTIAGSKSTVYVDEKTCGYLTDSISSSNANETTVKQGMEFSAKSDLLAELNKVLTDDCWDKTNTLDGYPTLVHTHVYDRFGVRLCHCKVTGEKPDAPTESAIEAIGDAILYDGAEGGCAISGTPGVDYIIGDVTKNDDGTYSCTVELLTGDQYAPDGYDFDEFGKDTVELVYDPETDTWKLAEDGEGIAKVSPEPPAKPTEDDVKAIGDAIVLVGADGTSPIKGNAPEDFVIGDVTKNDDGTYTCTVDLLTGDQYAPDGYEFDEFAKDTGELVFDPETGKWELAENGQGKAVVSPSAPTEDAVKALEDAVIINDDPDGESKKGILGSAPEDFEIGEVTKNDDGTYSCVVTITNPDLYPEDGHEVDEFEKPTVELIFDPETGAWRIAEGGEAVLNTKLSASEVTVTFVVPTHTNAVFGEVAPMVVTVPTGSYVEITLPAAPENTGEWVYVFRGWHAEGDEEGTWRKPGTTYKVTGNVTLTAVWRLASLTGDKTWNFRDAMAIMDHIDNSKDYTFCAEQLEIANFDLDAKNTINFRDSMAIMSFAEGTIPFPFSDDNPPKD